MPSHPEGSGWYMSSGTRLQVPSGDRYLSRAVKFRPEPLSTAETHGKTNKEQLGEGIIGRGPLHAL